jgi:hypothetical protein
MTTTRFFILSATLLSFTLSLTHCGDKKADSSAAAAPAVKDPDGFYALRSDASIKKHPDAGVTVGKGTLIEFHYDGSKGSGLDYQLYYVDQNGSVHPMSGSNFEDKGNGVFSREITVFNSSAHQRPGFMEVTTVAKSGLNDKGQITGKNVSLGMYAVRFEVSE